MARLVGKESSGNARDPDGGWLALPTALAPKLWLWVLHTSARAAASDTTPVMLSVAAIVLGLAALILWRSGAGAPTTSRRWRQTRGVLERAGGRFAAAGDDGRRRSTAARDEALRDRARSGTSADRAGRKRRAAGERRRRRLDGGVAGRAAHAVAESFPERARVDTGSSTFGRYRLLERLGEGGMAELYTAVLHGAEGFRRLFVVKRLRPHVARNRAAVEQFIDEAKLGSSLVHSNIVPVFDFGKVTTSTSWRRSTSSGAISAACSNATSNARAARCPSAWRCTSLTRCSRRWPTRTTAPTRWGIRSGSSTATSRRATSC